MKTPNKGEIERLRKAVFADIEDGDKDNYPSTASEKVDYAEYITVQSMTRLAPAIQRLSRFARLCVIGKGDLPNVIMYNEAKIARERLMHVKDDIDEALEMLSEVMDESRGAEASK